MNFNSIFYYISVSAKEINQDACVIGGYVLSSLIKKNIYQYIDILTEGSGMLLAEKVCMKYHTILTYFKRFGTVMFKYNDKQIEFVGAVENVRGCSIAISLNANNYGLLIDPLNISNYYYEDTLRMMRSICFAIELQFTEQISFHSIYDGKKIIRMIPIEGIINNFNIIILSHKPSGGLSLLYETGLLSLFLSEVTYLKVSEEKEGSYHKDNFCHTLEVVDNLSQGSNSIWLRWAALLHDIGKTITKKYYHGLGWSFHGHEYIGARMIPYLFHRLKLPLARTVKYVQKIIQYSSRPIALVSYEVTDTAIRRLLFYVGEDIEDLLLLCKADITTKNIERKLRFLNHFLLVERKLRNLDVKDSLRKWTPPISGHEIMQFFQLKPSPQVGRIKKAIKAAILDGELANDFTSVYSFMLEKGSKLVECV